MTAYRRKNKERLSANWKRYYQRKKTELYQKQKTYRAANPEKVRQWRRTDYERHRESYIARARRRWREKNDECRAYEAKRYRRDKPIIHARQLDYTNRNREKILYMETFLLKER